MDINGSIALVTGANSDIGRAFTTALLEEGARRVYAAARRPGEISDSRLIPLALNVTDSAAVASAAEACPDVSILINVAGGGGVLDVVTGSLDVARNEMEVNVFGTWAMAQAFAPILGRNGGGAMVNILSIVSWAAVPALSGYSAAKAAEWSLTNSLREALSGQGTLVVGVHSFWIDTRATKQVQAPKLAPDFVAQSAITAVREGRNELLLDEPTRSSRAALVGDIGSVRLGDVFVA
ncbi:SDR family NAD(P)-dependent oxidoreductase [Mycobacterium sp. 1423905.2]|uniref:SDR family NAD(P)-dependent oxidoreductase n=1 Tax=Mycobacterium sp. 1423905.2 TaxID=1856859 RepID=UPI00080139C8|nr:SDR family NAD(P)-dependent oxidoreductase [Mycobacterium sp. 1423905.2]OBJ54868.1 short-chain dehydrogenase [Mycobacterium sp. 1423905.2]